MTPTHADRHPCPSCGAPVPPRKYLCRACWFALPAGTRTALSKRDSQATVRLRALHNQLGDKVALGSIRVPP